MAFARNVVSTLNETSVAVTYLLTLVELERRVLEKLDGGLAVDAAELEPLISRVAVRPSPAGCGTLPPGVPALGTCDLAGFRPGTTRITAADLVALVGEVEALLRAIQDVLGDPIPTGEPTA